MQRRLRISSRSAFDPSTSPGRPPPTRAPGRVDRGPGVEALPRLAHRAARGYLSAAMPDRIVHCRLLKKDLPGLDRPPFRNDLGKRLFEQVSKEAWQQWLKDSVRFINTYRVDLVTPEGQSFMLKQCAIYFGFEEGDLAQTAWTPSAESESRK
jgi:Fe-S cluster biosynthesis and repair protein YggX